MKKGFLFAGLLMTFLSVPWPALVMAAEPSILLEVSDSEVKVGERLVVKIKIDDGDGIVDTARIHLDYSDNLAYEGLSLGEKYSKPLPGSGSLGDGTISVAGYTMTPEASEETVEFAQVTFIAKASGEASVKVLKADTRLIENGEERYDGSNPVQIAKILPAATGILAAPTITSSSHPNSEAWYKDSEVKFSWTEVAEMKGYAWAFDQEPNTEPTDLVPLGKNTERAEADSSGRWYVHLRGQTESGSWTDTAHYLAQIDYIKPLPVGISLDQDQILKGEVATMQFLALDELSKIDYYEMSVNDGPWEKVVSPVRFNGLPAGDYFIKVKAIDEAGNEVFGATTLRAYPEGADLGRPIQSSTDADQKEPANKSMILWIGGGILALVGIALGVRKLLTGKRSARRR